MKNDEVHTRIDVLLPIFFSIGHHQMAVDKDLRADTVSDALDEGRSEGDGAIDHPITIHDIQMNPINPCRNRFVHRLAKLAEICRENTGCDNHVMGLCMQGRELGSQALTFGLWIDKG